MFVILCMLTIWILTDKCIFYLFRFTNFVTFHYTKTYCSYTSFRFNQIIKGILGGMAAKGIKGVKGTKGTKRGLEKTDSSLRLGVRQGVEKKPPIKRQKRSSSLNTVRNDGGRLRRKDVVQLVMFRRLKMKNRRFRWFTNWMRFQKISFRQRQDWLIRMK